MVSHAYATYLASVRNHNDAHMCQRNIRRLELHGVDVGSLDGGCHCDPTHLYATAEHRDLWRAHESPIGEDFPGEYDGWKPETAGSRRSLAPIPATEEVSRACPAPRTHSNPNKQRPYIRNSGRASQQICVCAQKRERN